MLIKNSSCKWLDFSRISSCNWKRQTSKYFTEKLMFLYCIYFIYCIPCSSKTTFKRQFSNHKKSFNLNEYKNEIKLSNEVWQIKNLGNNPKVKWEIFKKCVAYNPQTKRCLVCLNQKLEIATYKEQNLLNKGNKIVSKCWHHLKYALAR